MKISMTLLLWLFAWSVQAQPPLRLCSFECTQQQSYSLQSETWQQLQHLFEQNAADAVAERAAIGRAVALIEQDVFTQLSRNVDNKNLDDHLQAMFSNSDETRNTRNIIALLSDRHLIYRHVLRRSEQRHAVFGASRSTTVIQSIDDGRLFAVDAASTGFGHEPDIQTLEQWRNSTPIRKLTTRIQGLFDRQPATTDSRDDRDEQR